VWKSFHQSKIKITIRNPNQFSSYITNLEILVAMEPSTLLLTILTASICLYYFVLRHGALYFSTNVPYGTSTKNLQLISGRKILRLLRFY